MQWNREGLVVLGGTNTEVFFFSILWNAANVPVNGGLCCVPVACLRRSSLLTIALLEPVWWVSVGNNRTPQL